MENKSFQEANFRQGMEFLRIVALAFNKANPSSYRIRELIKNPDPIYDAVGRLFDKKFDTDRHIRLVKSTWKRIYKEWFGIEKDFSTMSIPNNYDSTKHFVVIVAKELTVASICDAMRKKFKVDRMVDINLLEKISNYRTTEYGDYVVLFHNNEDVDEKFRGISTEQLESSYHRGITLMERLLLEILYFQKTKSHFNAHISTLCCGSRLDDFVCCVRSIYDRRGDGAFRGTKVQIRLIPIDNSPENFISPEVVA